MIKAVLLLVVHLFMLLCVIHQDGLTSWLHEAYCVFICHCSDSSLVLQKKKKLTESETADFYITRFLL